jgi:hypothetical protein
MGSAGRLAAGGGAVQSFDGGFHEAEAELEEEGHWVDCRGLHVRMQCTFVIVSLRWFGWRGCQEMQMPWASLGPGSSIVCLILFACGTLYVRDYALSFPNQCCQRRNSR